MTKAGNYAPETLKAIVAEARRQGFDNRTIADKLNLPLADVVRIEGENKMADLITMENFLNTKKELAVMAEVAAKFIDENGRTLKERNEYRQRTTFIARDGTATRPCDKEHSEILRKHEEVWLRQDAVLVQETAHLVDAMKGASFSAWCAAVRIVGLQQGIKLPLRPGDHDPDTGEV
jgi:hypothetical protein